jgi:hypothetical protein
MSSSELSSGGSKEKPTGAIASCVGAGTSVRNFMAALNRHAIGRGSKIRKGIITQKMKFKWLQRTSSIVRIKKASDSWGVMLSKEVSESQPEQASYP